ncbi:MAG: amidohydrolase family protein [Gemmatimonadaceae bacterium]|nr:amidohydrolase family protein [Gemmatimonadaceae bacterium]MDQ3520155.1 amidohydrolase family protein [Gemmatimonadota bacterium]
MSRLARATAAALLLVPLSGSLSAQGSTRGNTIAFVGANVIPMDRERVLENQTVIIRDGRIAEMGPASSIRVPAGVERIEARGKYLLPGLAEMHGHIPPPSAPAAFIENVLFLYVANGITTVRGMLGAPNQLELREKAKSGAIVAPTLYLAGPSLNGNSVNSPADAERMVREQKAQGWDLLKVHPGLTRDEYDAMVRAARDVGISFGGHVPAEVGLAHALASGQETIDHLDGYVEYLDGDKGSIDPARLTDAVRRSRESKTWIVPTMALWETLIGVATLDKLKSYPELKYMPPNMVKGWVEAHENRLKSPELDAAMGRRVAENRRLILKALHNGGVRVLMGTDAPQQFSVPGFSLHRELADMRKAGLSPYQILESGTRNVGAYFSAKDDFGTVAKGKRADLVLVDANPLENIGNLERRSGVMVRGRWLPEAEIRRRLEAIAEGYRK